MANLFSHGARAAARDEVFVRTLYHEHGNALLAYATRLTGDRATAEDVVQETLVRAWRNAEALTTGPGSVRAWLFTVARNLIVDQVRAKAVRPAEVAQTADAEPVHRDHAQRVVDSMSVLGALDKLSADHRAILLAVFFHDRSIAETAEALGIPPGTVKSRSHYALQALRTRLAGRKRALEGVSA